MPSAAAFDDLCTACRLGDLASVEMLLSTGVNVNEVDEFDCTPLYLASLCGHEPIVKLLLERGALCDTDKQEGARCVYGALTDSIRNLLILYDLSKAVDTSLPFEAHLRSIFRKSGILTKDIVVQVGADSLKLHRFIMGSRSSTFKKLLKDCDGIMHLEGITDFNTFNVAMENLYLVHDAQNFENVDKNALLKYAEKIEINALVDGLAQYIESKEPTKDVNKMRKRLSEEALVDFRRLVKDHIIGGKIVTNGEQISSEQIKQLQKSDSFPDIILSVKEEDMITYYPVHRAILIRNKYFETMFTSSFSEASQYTTIESLGIVDRSTIPVISSPIPTYQVAEIVIKYLYHDHSNIPLEHTLDVLYTADILMDNRLKGMAVVKLTSSKTPPRGYDLYDVLRAAWETRSDRLERHVAKLIAQDLDKFLADDQFAAVVLESSERIDNRQKTDTIELIDDIRFYLEKKWDFACEACYVNEDNLLISEYSSDYEFYQKDLDKIEELLTELGLDA